MPCAWPCVLLPLGLGPEGQQLHPELFVLIRGLPFETIASARNEAGLSVCGARAGGVPHTDSPQAQTAIDVDTDR